ncbi:hypothetical protein BX600DRAFT_457125 [Xylariales sp. PMI_506]|nr:hypothetical protein BX600DRAFT_457125 [Xylariales sp. PMI_506]
MARNDGYYMAPKVTYKPSGPIQLGNIIAHPSRPDRALSTLNPTAPPLEIETVTEHNHELSQLKGHNFSAGLWAQFTWFTARKVADANTSYSVETFETRYLRNIPSDEELRSRVSEPQVKAAIAAGRHGKAEAPIFLIAGLKIARGLTARSEANKTRSGSLNASGPGMPDGTGSVTSVGENLGLEMQSGQASSFWGGDEDIIFAYELLAIRVRSRGSKETIQTDMCASKAAQLHNDEDHADADSTSGAELTIEPAALVDFWDSGGDTEFLQIRTEEGLIMVYWS